MEYLSSLLDCSKCKLLEAEVEVLKKSLADQEQTIRDQSEKLNDAKNEIAELKEKLAGPETQASGEAAASAKEDTSVAPNDEACASTKDDLSLPAKDERKKIFDENLDVTAIFGESSKSPGNVHKELKRPSASTSSDGPPNKHSDGE